MARTQSQGNQPPFDTIEVIPVETPKRKRTMSAAGRRRISQAAKRRWEEAKAQGGGAGTKGQRGRTTGGNLEAFLETSWSPEQLTQQLEKARIRMKTLEALLAAHQPARTMSAGGQHYENS